MGNRMNERQKKSFEEWADGHGWLTPLNRESAKSGYSAACQDEADRAQGLVRALESISTLVDCGCLTNDGIILSKVAMDAIAAYKGDAKFPIQADPTLPKGTAEFRYGNEVVGRIVNLGDGK